MDTELATKLQYLRCPALLAGWDDYLTLAANKRFSHATLLQHVVDQEYNLRKQNAGKHRLARARIPEPWSIETYPFHRQPKLNKKAIMALYDTQSFLKDRRNIIWLGKTGVGKTGLAASFLAHSIARGATGLFIRFPELIHRLHQSLADHSERKWLKRLAAYDIILIDELGYIELEPVQVGLFFTLMEMRYKRQSTLITSNLGFSDWKSFLKNPDLTVALIDRLTEISYVFNMKDCISLRDKLSPTIDT